MAHPYIDYNHKPEGSWFNQDRPYYKCSLRSDSIDIECSIQLDTHNKKYYKTEKQWPIGFQIPENTFEIIKMPDGTVEVVRNIHPYYLKRKCLGSSDNSTQDTLKRIDKKDREKEKWVKDIDARIIDIEVKKSNKLLAQMVKDAHKKQLEEYRNTSTYEYKNTMKNGLTKRFTINCDYCSVTTYDFEYTGTTYACIPCYNKRKTI